MATTFTWRVQKVKYDPNDDKFIKEITVEIYGTEGSITKMETQGCVFTGDKSSVADFKAYSTFIDDNNAFTSTGEATLVDWVETRFMDYKVAKIQKRIQNQIDLHNKKTIETDVEPTSTVAKPTVTQPPEE